MPCPLGVQKTQLPRTRSRPGPASGGGSRAPASGARNASFDRRIPGVEVSTQMEIGSDGMCTQFPRARGQGGLGRVQGNPIPISVAALLDDPRIRVARVASDLLPDSTNGPFFSKMTPLPRF